MVPRLANRVNPFFAFPMPALTGVFRPPALDAATRAISTYGVLYLESSELSEAVRGKKMPADSWLQTERPVRTSLRRRIVSAPAGDS